MVGVWFGTDRKLLFSSMNFKNLLFPKIRIEIGKEWALQVLKNYRLNCFFLTVISPLLQSVDSFSGPQLLVTDFSTQGTTVGTAHRGRSASSDSWLRKGNTRGLGRGGNDPSEITGESSAAFQEKSVDYFKLKYFSVSRIDPKYIVLTFALELGDFHQKRENSQLKCIFQLTLGVGEQNPRKIPSRSPLSNFRTD